MKLYYTPGACPLAVHILLCELGLPHELVKVDLKTKKLEDGGDYLAVNPKGYVPALVLDSGDTITEIPAIVQHLADTHPDAGLLAAPGQLERTRAIEWLTFAGTELHRSFSPLFNPNASDDLKQASRERLAMRFGYLNQALEGKAYLLGERFSVADPYIFTILNWTFIQKIDLAPWGNLAAYHQRVAQRPSVQAAMRAQGLI